MLVLADENVSAGVRCDVHGAVEAGRVAIGAFFDIWQNFRADAGVWWVFQHRAFEEASTEHTSASMHLSASSDWQHRHFGFPSAQELQPVQRSSPSWVKQDLKLDAMPVELFRLVAEFLPTQGSQSSLGRANVHLRNAVLPVLYNSIRIDLVGEGETELIPAMLSHDNPGLVHVRELVLDFEISVELELDLNGEIVRTERDRAWSWVKILLHALPRNRLQAFRWMSDQKFDSKLWLLLLKKQRQLEHLMIANLSQKQSNDIELLQGEPWVLGGLKAVKCLTLRPMSKSDIDLMAIVLPKCGTLTHLSVSYSDLAREHWSPTIDEAATEVFFNTISQLPHGIVLCLTTLSIYVDLENAANLVKAIDTFIVRSIKTGLKKLHLQVDSSEEQSIIPSVGAITRHGRTLEKSYVDIRSKHEGLTNCVQFFEPNDLHQLCGALPALRQVALPLPTFENLLEPHVPDEGPCQEALESIAQLPALVTLKIINWPQCAVVPKLPLDTLDLLHGALSTSVFKHYVGIKSERVEKATLRILSWGESYWNVRLQKRRLVGLLDDHWGSQAFLRVAGKRYAHGELTDTHAVEIEKFEGGPFFPVADEDSEILGETFSWRYATESW
ncbi:hypothetical protein LTS18_014855 [Coniosporium uncinatum]|uniref:Uncharacterized protein n=1 Tax=Coniosporium uncinatum TaxID=93489 RepID=A0ACC3DV19_9PEZI|nr:hypothetical protein LTS18_014855 [Coniosporium uncinatum]